MNQQIIKKRLDATLGFEVPTQYSAFINWCYNVVDWRTYKKIAGEVAFNYPLGNLFESWSAAFYAVVEDKPIDAAMLAGNQHRYPYTPPEVFIAFWLGADGVHYGILNRAPELNEMEMPFVCCDPYCWHVQILGDDFFSGLGSLIDLQFCWKEEMKKKGRERKIRENHLVDLAKWINHTITPKRFDTNKTHSPKAVKKNWQFEMTADGVGVYAPKTAFSPKIIRIIPDDSEVDFLLEKAEKFLQKGFPASALWTIRENYLQNHLHDHYAKIAPFWARAYEDLGRGLLAAHVRQNVK